MPTVDVVIPAYNEERHIGRCLDCVLGQDYPAEKVNVYAVDAGGGDATGRILRERAAAEPRLTVLGGERRRRQPEALNLAVAAGGGELVARVDARNFIAPDYLSKAVAALAEAGPEVAVVGGHRDHRGETPFGRAVALAQTSRLGVGGSVYVSRAQRTLVDTVPYGVFRRSALDAVGEFDTALPVAEDEDMTWRLREAGYKVLLDAGLEQVYVPRSSFAAAFEQYRVYGRNRVRVVRKHPGYLRPYHLVPAAAVALGSAAGALAPFSRTARRALCAGAAAYGGVLALNAVRASPDEPALAARVAAACVALHAGYGVGMLAELSRPAS
ncbi:MAG TPA: glycosyltransferase [Solirubrobacteraceae bacterium]|jgi:glycosyltransferase involved in cell wall biosynthesis